MNSQNDKEGSGHVKAAVIGGIFALLAACVGGAFLLLNTMVNNGVIVFGASNPSVPPTATASQYQEPTSNSPSIQPTTAQVSTQSSNTSAQNSTPLRDQKNTPIVGTGVLEQGTYSDGMASISASEINSHLNIQRFRLEENPDGCGIAFMDADKIWFGSSVKTNLTINDVVVGTINAPTGKHGYMFNATVHSGDKVCVSYFEPSGFQIVFGPDIYYHYDSYCYRGNC